MTAPIVSFFDEDDETEYDNAAPFNFGLVDASTTSPEKPLNVWNNKGGEAAVSDMTNVRATTVTKNGLSSGDGFANGQEVVENDWILIKSETNEEEEFTAIGGADTHTLADISGAVGGAKHETVLKGSVPSDAGAGLAEFKIRILYQYT